MTRPFIAVTPDVADSFRAAAFEPGRPTSAQDQLCGIPVVTVASSLLKPSERAMAGIDGRRIVRHGLADVLEWLGEDVGPKPGDPAPVMAIIGDLADRIPHTAIEWASEVHRGRERMTVRYELPPMMTPADAYRVVTGL